MGVHYLGAAVNHRFRNAFTLRLAQEHLWWNVSALHLFSVAVLSCISNITWTKRAKRLLSILDISKHVLTYFSLKWHLKCLLAWWLSWWHYLGEHLKRNTIHGNMYAVPVTLLRGRSTNAYIKLCILVHWSVLACTQKFLVVDKTFLFKN